MYKYEQQFPISCLGALQPRMRSPQTHFMKHFRNGMALGMRDTLRYDSTHCMTAESLEM